MSKPRFTGPVLAALVAAISITVGAQEPASPAAVTPVTPPMPVRNVRIDVTIVLQGPTEKQQSKKMTLVAADRQMALGRSGIEVPVQMGSGSNYRSVGFNVDARPQVQADNRISLMVKLNFSTILDREEGTSTPPSFANSSTELNLMLESGRPIVIAQAADAELKRGYSVEVKATLLK